MIPKVTCRTSPMAPRGKKMIDGQWRAARALIGWSQRDLADKLGASVLSVKRLENGADGVSDDMRGRAKAALEAAGVEFIDGGRPGVRMKAAPPRSSDEAAIGEIPDNAEPYDGAPM